MGSSECLFKHYERKDKIQRTPRSTVLVRPQDIVDDPLAPFLVDGRERLRENASVISLRRDAVFEGFLLTDASPIGRDDPLVNTVFSSDERASVGIDSAAQVYAAYVRVPAIHQPLLPNPYDTSTRNVDGAAHTIDTQQERDMVIQLHTLCVFTPKAYEEAKSKSVFTPVIIQLSSDGIEHAKITETGGPSPLPLPPLLDDAPGVTEQTPTDLLGDFDSLNGVDFEGECEDDGIIRNTKGTTLWDEQVHHTLTDIFPTAQLPYDATVTQDEPRITSPMCSREDPIARRQGRTEIKSHKGTDIAFGPPGNSREGDPIVAPYTGRVTHVNKDNSLSTAGYYIILDHGETSDGQTVFTKYLHLQEGSVTKNIGQVVVQGEVIGKVGNTGASDGAHLHYEIRLNMNPDGSINTGHPIPPFVYITPSDGARPTQ